MTLKDISAFSSCGNFAQQSRTDFANLVEDCIRNILNLASDSGEDIVKLIML